MRILVLVLFIFINNIIANDSISAKLYEKIFEGIYPNKKEIFLYNIGNSIYKFDKIKYTKEIYRSDIIFISEYYNLKIINNKPIFASNKQQLEKYRNSIGALYWEKGEPKIILLRKRLEQHNIKVEDYLKKYIVD